MGMSADDLLRDRLPEGGDTPQPETAPAGETRLYAGKYKTVEEMEAGYAEAQRKITQTSEEKARLESIVLSGSQAVPGMPGADPYSALYPQAAPPAPALDPYRQTPDPNEFISRAESAANTERIVATRVQEVLTRQQQQAQLTQEQAYWRDELFRRHADIKDDVDLVYAKVPEVAARYQHLAPNVFRAMMPTILDEIAAKVHERKSQLRSQWEAETTRKDQERAAGQLPGAPGPASPPSTQKELSREETINQRILEEQQRHLKTKVLLR